ncbi:MAG TPA: sigma-70 family RNA polymerase sigma factor [Gemmatimonadota bacterium]|nr:sigma-70 family RNA polymerase sigma factor [Gemmatimonadota bacterium]
MERGPLPPATEIQSLLMRVAEGETQALAELYDATARYVFGILRRMLWSAESAEEVAQEVYLQVWKTAGSFDPERGSAWSWLALLTRSRAIDRMRADGSYRDAVDDLQRIATRSSMEESDGNLLQDIARSERAEVIHAALRDLPGDQRRALELAFFGGLSHREIADRTETPLGTVKTRIRTALLKLRERLETEFAK